ncbi:MAG: glycosyltransferase family 2 protein [Candidatus Omnitrophica bacterium]|nr:glycosyltransferase family 2 protein [Candidatus Omnitrophota bacterium]
MKIGLYIPCFNAEKHIGATLKGVFKQRLMPDEVVVVDDASTDDTARIVSRYPVRLVGHKRNKGLAAARNTAIKSIDADLIASLDADCVPEPDWLSLLSKRVRAGKASGAGGRLAEAHTTTVFDLWRSTHMRQYWHKKQTQPPFLFGSNALFCKEALMKAGLYKEDLRNNYEDVDICQRLKKKGCKLSYEPKALAHHQRRDSAYSVLSGYWNWHFPYYQKKGYYSSEKRLKAKIKDSIGLANRYMTEDIKARRYRLVYMDFLLGFHHVVKDFEYYLYQKNGARPDATSLSCWLSLLDLTFSYHYFRGKQLTSLAKKDLSFQQNFFAMNLVLGKVVRDHFSRSLHKRLFRDILMTTYKIKDSKLVDKLHNLVTLHPDWNDLRKKNHPNLREYFLDAVYLNYHKWLNSLAASYPKAISMIEAAAKR